MGESITATFKDMISKMPVAALRLDQCYELADRIISVVKMNRKNKNVTILEEQYALALCFYLLLQSYMEREGEKHEG